MRLNSHPSGRHFLQIPGPTNVPDRILRAMDYPTIDHRGPEFNALAKKVLRSVRQVFQTKQPVIVYPASGTGAWEAALVNTLSPGDLVLMWETGHFASLWKKMADKLGIKSEFMGGDWRKPADPAAIEKRLKEDTGHAIKAVCIVHNETSTGVVSDIGAVRRAIDAAKHPALLLVDTISSLGSIDYRHDAWGVDVTVAGSQKGLMLPPGLSFNAISEKALAASKTSKMTKAFWGWDEMLATNANGWFPYTPATNLIYGLGEACDMLLEEGLDAVFARHARHAEATRTAVDRLGPRDPVQRSQGLFGRADGDRHARGPRRRRLPQGGAGELQHVARPGPDQGRRQGVPHRPSRRLQRPDADGRAVAASRWRSASPRCRTRRAACRPPSPTSATRRRARVGHSFPPRRNRG